jgi:hypothetical protein
MANVWHDPQRIEIASIGDAGKISAAALSATISGLGSIAIYGVVAWFGFWCTIVGRQLAQSLGLTREL